MMAKAQAGSVDDYIRAQPRANQATLRQVRAAIRRALPEAEEAIAYQMPAFKLHGVYVVYFAGWREHYSLYPVTAKAQQALKAELAAYELSKGTVRFPLGVRVPVRLIGRIVKFLAGEAAQRAAARLARRRTVRIGRRPTSA